jgi:hypothetical protein
LVEAHSGHEKHDETRKEPDICAALGVPWRHSMNPDHSPAAVVQRQLEAYNAKDLDALLAIYADDATLHEHPDKLLAQGTAALRERFAARFQEPNLHAALLHRIVAGDIVIDHERVTRTFPEGAGTIELVMIYEVKAGRITRAWTMAGGKELAKT